MVRYWPSLDLRVPCVQQTDTIHCFPWQRVENESLRNTCQYIVSRRHTTLQYTRSLKNVSVKVPSFKQAVNTHRNTLGAVLIESFSVVLGIQLIPDVALPWTLFTASRAPPAVTKSIPSLLTDTAGKVVFQCWATIPCDNPEHIEDRFFFYYQHYWLAKINNFYYIQWSITPP